MRKQFRRLDCEKLLFFFRNALDRIIFDFRAVKKDFLGSKTVALLAKNFTPFFDSH